MHGCGEGVEAGGYSQPGTSTQRTSREAAAAYSLYRICIERSTHTHTQSGKEERNKTEEVHKIMAWSYSSQYHGSCWRVVVSSSRWAEVEELESRRHRRAMRHRGLIWSPPGWVRAPYIIIWSDAAFLDSRYEIWLFGSVESEGGSISIGSAFCVSPCTSWEVTVCD